MILSYKQEFKSQCLEIFNSLEFWFEGDNDAIANDYANQLNPQDSWVYRIDGKVIGLISMLWHFDSTAEIYSMGILENQHRKGIGNKLFDVAEQAAKDRGFEFIHVKTLGDSLDHKGYKRTRAFYEAKGFKKLFQTTGLWDPLPTMLYIKTLS